MEEFVIRFDELFNLTYLVIDSLKGKSISDYRYIDCERLAHKVFMHAATIRHLCNGSNVYLQEHQEGAHIEDFASIIVLVRAAFETYINLFELYFEPTDDDEFEYRHATFQIEGFRLREQYIPLDAATHSIHRLQQFSNEIEEMRERVRNTNKYKQILSEKQRSKSLDGRKFPERTITQIAAAAGFSVNFAQQQFAYQSGYVHGDALSISQIADAHDNPSTLQQKYLVPAIGFVMIILSKLIINFQEKYPEAKMVCETNGRTMQLVNYLSNLAGQFDDVIGKATRL